jgi:phosphoglycerol transferase MdoB-like AlkP superfamily enzyme
MMRRAIHWLLAGPYAALPRLLAAYLAFQALVRLALGVFNGDPGIFGSGRIFGALAFGLIYDLAVAGCFLLPLLLMLLFLRNGSPPATGGFGRRLVLAALLPFSAVLVFIGAAEFVFWNEFASRFNFIAVDYLVYTNEVIGNIRESYPLPLLLSAVALASLALWWLLRRWVRPLLQAPVPALPGRLARSAVWLLLPLAGIGLLDASGKEFSPDSQANQLAGNGVFEFFHAYRTNEIDYERFYRTLPDSEALAHVRRALHIGGSPRQAFDIRREVAPAAAEKRWNVVLVSIESLSASYLGHFGNRSGITPNLDRLADEGLLFTQLYATGTRTVRGLEALSLSVPPTPGHSIVKRPANDHLYTLGSVFAQKGYRPLYVYGGYAYFDNMRAFYEGNGYRVADRSGLADEEIRFQNIWGVSDEDLYTLALREIDREVAAGQRVFAHVMTVSNHRPYTYPDDRVAIPSGDGRDGGVQYTDWAIGDFIRRARERPWFDDTLFVFVADHTHRGRGKMELPPRNYQIPMIVWAPGKIAPGRVEHLSSQIDVAPTLLGLLDFHYESRFFGNDILAPGARRRALLANYQTVGWYEDGLVIELKPNARSRVVDARTGLERAPDARSEAMTAEAISLYQIASESFGSGALRLDSPPAHTGAAGAR